jgi:parallel beta-helix repeat protein
MTSKTVTVSNAAQLTAAARAARGGETILLAPGSYGDVRLDNLRPTGTVTIKSANPDNDAVLRSLTMHNSQNFVVQDIDVSRPLGDGQARNTFAVSVTRAHNITFVGIDVSGSMNNDARDDGHGMTLRGSRLSVLDSTFTQLGFAVTANGSDYVFAGNTMTQVREGMQMADMQRALVANNVARDFQANYETLEHPDVFQVHTGGSFKASSDLVFRNNVMAIGENGGVGGIFIQSESAIKQRHRNILIENNVYEGNFTHGVSVSNADNVTIRGNTVRAGLNSGFVSSIIVSDISDALIEKNVTQMLLVRKDRGISTGLVMRDNVDVWDWQQKRGIASADVYEQQISTASARLDTSLFSDPGVGDIDFSEFNVRSTSVAARLGAGFRTVADIGSLQGTAEQQMAAWLPSLDASISMFG